METDWETDWETRVETAVELKVEPDVDAKNLTVRETAELLKVSEKTVYRWIRQGVLPTFRVQGQYRFDRVEIEGWARYKKIGGGLRRGLRAEVQEETVSLLEAVRRGGIHYKIEGNDPERIFPALVDFLPFGPDYPAELKETLVAELRRREALAPTAIGHGIALPHPRHPRDWGFGGPVAGFFFLEAPVDFAAVDGQPVFLLVMILCATVKGHLSMLSRVTHLLADPALREYLAGSPARSELMEKIAHAFPKSSPAGRG